MYALLFGLCLLRAYYLELACAFIFSSLCFSSLCCLLSFFHSSSHSALGQMGNSGSTDAIHVALLGDSSFDNGNWTDGPCVTEQVRAHFPQTSMCARDGALIAAIEPQSKKIPKGVTHVVVSVGGNDATAAVNVVKTPCSDGEQAILELWKFVKAWERDFANAVLQLRKRVGVDMKIVLCSIYSPCFGPFGVTTVSQDTADAFIALVADAMLRVATRFGLPIIDWRRVMNKVEDFANPIEPSSTGGLKMAKVRCHLRPRV